MATNAHAARPRSPLFAEVLRLARDSAPKAVERLINIVECAEDRESIAAAQLVLAYAVGKPREATLDPAEMTDAELLAEVTRRERLAHAARAAAAAINSGSTSAVIRDGGTVVRSPYDP